MGTLLLWIHVLAAATWFGAAVAVMMTTPRMRTAGDGAAATWQLLVVDLGRKLFTPAAIVSLATGIGLVIDGGFDWGSAFVSIGFAMVIIGAVLGMRFYAPIARQVAALHETGEASGAELLYARARMLGTLELGLLAITIWAMVAKLGA